ncbi:tetratricopeptide repeat protein [Telmatobacter sp. DSM 110680]|uniref:Tetratricopeptide repeat protein n=1 Tax=Telmatobacter sp. DSM 110680 TaxID=3036704 RepID=A0AAU7DNZ3_9BACT
MKIKTLSPSLWLPLALSLVAGTSLAAQAPNAPAKPGQPPPASASEPKSDPKPTPTAASTPAPDRSQAYYHSGLAHIYEEDAIASGRPEFMRHAVEEYKTALSADPESPQLNDELADLYFRTGQVREAEATARGLLKTSPNDIDAHRLLGRLYLRQLSEAQNSVSSSSPTGNTLDQAIAEFQKIVTLDSKSVEDRMVLGQLYTVKHQNEKAEEQFKAAQDLDPDSEEVVLNLSRLYAENGDLAHASKVIEAVPVSERTPKMEFALGGVYDQLKRPKDAIDAYKRAVDLDPEDAHNLAALAQALLNDNQLDAALKQYRQLADADPQDSSTTVHISEILRRQGKYEEALTTIKKAVKKDPDSLEAGYNEGLLLDVLGRYDEAAQVYEHMVDLTSHANGAYTADEKNNRAIFLERLGAVYHEQNKVDEAISTYQKMIDLGGENALRGYQNQVDVYRDAKMFDKAIAVSHKAVDSNPKDQELKLMLAAELVDQGKDDEGIAMAKGLLKNNPDDQKTWITLGQIYTRLRKWKDAEDALNKATSITSKKEDNIYLLFLKGGLAERQKHFEPAEQYFHQALELDPNNAMVLNYLGYMLADKGNRLPEALKMIRKAVELEPMNGAYLDSLGWAYFKLGQYELAEENLRQAVERDQTDPTVHDHLGDLYEKTGRIRLAAAQWELSLSEYSKSAPPDVEPTEVAKVQKKLETARVKLAKQENTTGPNKPE